MKKVISLLAVGATLIISGTALGQVQNRQPGFTPTTRPTVSPYVLLGSNRRTPAINYFGIVRQQQSIRSSVRQLGERVSLDEAQTAADVAAAATPAATAPLPATGHTTSFQNHSHFFPSTPGTGVGSIWSGGTSIRARRQ